MVSESVREEPYLVVLGIGQDGGRPQAGSRQPELFERADYRRYATSLAVVDPASGARYLFEATPDFPEQLAVLDSIAPYQPGGDKTGCTGAPCLAGIFLTHAHVGHYVGLLYVGFEVIGADRTPVYAAPRMAKFLNSNGPWSQLVSYDNIELRELELGEAVTLEGGLSVTAYRVPHREEFSEVVGYEIRGPNRAALFIPDIDSWEDWDDQGIVFEQRLAAVDLAFVDGTFWADGEIEGRDMSGFPHPRISKSLERFRSLSDQQRTKIHFIHLNHTNPALDPSSPESKAVVDAGSHVARRMDRHSL